MTKSFFKKLLLTALFTSHITPSVHAQQWNLHYSHVGKTLVETQKSVTTNTHVSVEDKYALGIITAIGGIIAGYALYSWADDWYQSYKENRIPLSTSLQEAEELLNCQVVQVALTINWGADTLYRFSQLEKLNLTNLSPSYKHQAAPIINALELKLKKLNRRKESSGKTYRDRRDYIDLTSTRTQIKTALSHVHKLIDLINYYNSIQNAQQQAKRIVNSHSQLLKEIHTILEYKSHDQVTLIKNIVVNNHLTRGSKSSKNASDNRPAYPFINYKNTMLDIASKIESTLEVIRNSSEAVKRAYGLTHFELIIKNLKQASALIELHPTYIVELNLKQQEDARRREEEHRQEMARVARRQMEQAEKHQREMERLAHQQARATENLAEAQKMQAAAQLAAALNPQPQHITIEIHNDN